MELGFLLLDGITRVRPDRSLTKRTNPRVLLARFGDGYEQRMPDGINSLDQSFSVTFINRPIEEVDAIVEFFEAMLGVTSFEFTIPDTRAELKATTIKVVCDSWDYVYTNHSITGCSANFRRVYE